MVQGTQPRGRPDSRCRRGTSRRLFAPRRATGPRIQPGRCTAACVRCRFPVRGDRGPGRCDRPGRRGPARAEADGSRGVRRRRLRQDRGRAQGSVRRGAGWQAGCSARADDAARAAALPDVRRSLRRLAGPRGTAVPVPWRRAGEGCARGTRGRPRRHRRRHAPDAATRRTLQGPRAADHRRGTPLRRARQGAAEGAASRSRRAHADGDADSRARSTWRSGGFATCR